MSSESKPEGKPDPDDLVMVERSEKRRPIVGMAGQYMLDRGQDGRRHPCTIVKMTPTTITLDVPVTGAVGEWIIVRFEDLGQFEGPILHVVKRTVSMRIVATQQERAKLAAKLAWFEDQSVAERRRFVRYVPRDPHSMVCLPNGQKLPCTLIDYSAGGAAVFADVTPPKGTPLKIAQVEGEVVRHFDGGFAVNFATVQDPRSLESLLHDAA